MNDKVAIVTGGSRGIGRAIALELARDGFKVVVNYQSGREGAEAEAESVLQEIESLGSSAIIFGADVAHSDGAQALVDAAVQAFGRVDVLVNNVGINKDQLMVRISDEEWQHVLNTNLNTAFYCSRAALKYMTRQRYGRIINITAAINSAPPPAPSIWPWAGLVEFITSFLL
jgi:3-oxoacyl-[acyl-carrier protein] reductase